MVRVIPGSDIKELYDERKIYSSNIQGDDYKVRRSANDANLDPRANTFWQKQVIDKMSLAGRIWKNKKPCWQDHFKRSKKTFRYGSSMDGIVEKTLSGYKLGINLLMQSLTAFDGTFYDPDCFCIKPIDMLGYVLDGHCRLEIQYDNPVSYVYNEQKRPVQYSGCQETFPDPFCSAVKPRNGIYNICKLTAPYAAPRNNDGLAYFSDLKDASYMVMWPPFIFKAHDAPLVPPIPIWQSENWMYNEIPPEMYDGGYGCRRKIEMRMKNAINPDGLCGHGYIGLDLAWGGDDLAATVFHTDIDPLYDLYWGDHLIGTYGAGSGPTMSDGVEIPADLSTTQAGTNFRFHDYINPPGLSWQPEIYPIGKLTEARLMATEFGPQVGLDCIFRWIKQYWETSEPIHFEPMSDRLSIKLNIWGYGGSGNVFQPCSEFGCFWFYACDDQWNCHKIHSPATDIKCNGWSQEYCVWNDLVEGDYTRFMTYMFNTMGAVWPSKVYTMFGDPTCEICPGPSGCAMPCPGQRGLWFLEKDKDFVIKDPCCRCPEDMPPGCSHLPKCPKDSSKRILNYNCYDVHSASSKYLVYDMLK